MKIRIWTLAIAVGWAVGCNRNMEPFVPGEEPREPDLSKIFPAGAQPPPNPVALPPSPGGGRDAAPVAPPRAEPISGVVVVAPELSERVREGSVLFLIARSGAAGPPTAVKRIASPQFPYEFSVGPEDRMVQAVPFTGPLTLTARLDADGNASTREPGDMQGRLPEAVDPGARGLTLTLDEIH
jgi:hypothetical protein